MNLLLEYSGYFTFDKMAEGGADNYFLGIGRGKYLMQFSDNKPELGESSYKTDIHAGHGRNHMAHDVHKALPVTSTPKPGNVKSSSDRDVSELGALVKELGRQIGDSVTAKLLSGGEFTRTNNGNNTTGSQCANLDLSQLNVILKSDDKDPPVFRGDGLGRCDVQEWVEMMQTYLQKRNVKVPEQADEIISRLMGRAKDIVKVALRSNPALDCTNHPEIIYSILKQHFSEVSYSSMPLADFYSTLPKRGENPVDYWLRLNKAADIADECLRGQGRRMDNLNSEVAMMFVRNCPDPDLARTFKIRPLEHWTAKEVQELLDSFQRELKLKSSANTYPISQNAHTTIQNSGNSNVVSESTLICLKQGTNGPGDFNQDAKDNSGLNRMADMLAQLIEVLKAKEETKPEYVSSGRVRRRNTTGPRNCKICGDTTHTTFDHCRSDHLCFRCHGTGHSKRDCTVILPNSASASIPPNSQGN